MTNYYCDTLGNSFFRLSMEDLVDLERKRRCGITRQEILAKVYCPITPPPPTRPPPIKKSESYGGGLPSGLVTSRAICVEGSRTGIPWSSNDTNNNGGQNVVEATSSGYKTRNERKAQALRELMRKEVRSAKTAAAAAKADSWSSEEVKNCRNYVVVRHGVPINSDYQILKQTLGQNDIFSMSELFGKSFNADTHHQCSASSTSGAAATFSVRPKTSSTGFQPSNPTKENRPHSSAGTEASTGGFKLLESALSGPLRSKPVTPNVPRRNINGKNFFKKRRSNAVEHCGDYSEHNDEGRPQNESAIEFTSHIRVSPAAPSSQKGSQALKSQETSGYSTTMVKQSNDSKKSPSLPRRISPKTPRKKSQAAPTTEGIKESSASSAAMNTDISVSPRFNWKDVDRETEGRTLSDITGANEQTIKKQLMALHRSVSQRDKHFLNQLVKAGVDMTLPLRGVTALSLSLYLKYRDMTIEIVDAMKEAGQLQRGLNVCSVDSASRREPPLVTAARTGQTEALSILLKCKGIEVEKRDGQGRSALWHAVKEEKDDAVRVLVENGARIFYNAPDDMECPLQVACKNLLQQSSSSTSSSTASKGVAITKYLIRHGCNIDYYDHALRNALYWAVYYSCPEVVLFLLEAGVKIRPWSWIQEDALPTSFTRNEMVSEALYLARSEPASLLVQARAAVRIQLSKATKGCSIYPLVESLRCLSEDLKGQIVLESRPSPIEAIFGRVASANRAKKKLKKLTNETKV